MENDTLELVLDAETIELLLAELLDPETIEVLLDDRVATGG
jgi:hypothetical protein